MIDPQGLRAERALAAQALADQYSALLHPWARMACHRFADRDEAGLALVDGLRALALDPLLRVLALPRGGVPVAARIAQALQAPLDVLQLCRIGAPTRPELAVAVVVEGNPPEVVVNPEAQDVPGVDLACMAPRVPAALQEIERRRAVYLQGRPPLPVAGATVILVDDGMATGTTMRAALRTLRRREPARVVVAVPVAPYACVVELEDEVDDVVCLIEPRPFHAIGLHYLDFHPLTDLEVCQALARANRPA